MFNNEIYGLTKGQYSPTSERGKVTKSTPMGSIDQPFNPLSLALGAEATFVARAIDTDKKTMAEVLRKAAAHKGSAFVEIYQNCNIYNDGAFDLVRDDETNRIVLSQGEPIRFGEDGEKGVVQRDGRLGDVVDVAEVGEDALLRHDEHHEEPSLAFALSRLTLGTVGATPIGVFRDVERPVYDELMASQIEQAQAERGEGDLQALVGVRGHLADLVGVVDVRRPQRRRAAAGAGRVQRPRPRRDHGPLRRRLRVRGSPRARPLGPPLRREGRGASRARWHDSRASRT